MRKLSKRARNAVAPSGDGITHDEFENMVYFHKLRERSGKVVYCAQCGGDGREVGDVVLEHGEMADPGPACSTCEGKGAYVTEEDEE